MCFDDERDNVGDRNRSPAVGSPDEYSRHNTPDHEPTTDSFTDTDLIPDPEARSDADPILGYRDTGLDHPSASDSGPGGTSSADFHTNYELLTHPRRLHLLSILDATERISVSALAEELVAVERTQSPTDSGNDVSTVKTALVHAHLPLLADAGIVEFDRESQVVAAIADRPVSSSRLSRLSHLAAAAGDDADRLLRTLVHPTRIAAYSAIESAAESISVDEIATCIHDENATHTYDDDTSHNASIEDVRLSLYHSHLPALASVGVIEFDRTERTASIPDRPIPIPM